MFDKAKDFLSLLSKGRSPSKGLHPFDFPTNSPPNTQLGLQYWRNEKDIRHKPLVSPPGR